MISSKILGEVLLKKSHKNLEVLRRVGTAFEKEKTIVVQLYLKNQKQFHPDFEMQSVFDIPGSLFILWNLRTYNFKNNFRIYSTVCD